VAALQPGGLLLGVADGMGGMIAGEVASQMCTEQLPPYLLKRLQQHPEAPSLDRRLALTEAIRETSQFIYAWAAADERRRGMGTTLTAALLAAEHLYVAQVGDSRAYLWRAGKLQQLTRDQTVWNSLSESGQVSLAGLGNAAWKHLLTQAVGALPAIQVEITETALQPDDWLLLCSDGLHRVVSPDEIAAILGAETAPAEKARALVARANQHGGPDNISVIVCQLASISE